MRHAFGIPALTKSRFGRFGKNKSYEVLTPDRRFAFMTEFTEVPVCTILTLETLSHKRYISLNKPLQVLGL